MKWYNYLILVVALIGLSVLVGYQLKKCPTCLHNIPVHINIDSINHAQELERKAFTRERDSLRNELKRKPTKIIFYETIKDSTNHPDTTHIPAIFRTIADHYGR